MARSGRKRNDCFGAESRVAADGERQIEMMRSGMPCPPRRAHQQHPQYRRPYCRCPCCSRMKRKGMSGCERRGKKRALCNGLLPDELLQVVVKVFLTISIPATDEQVH